MVVEGTPAQHQGSDSNVWAHNAAVGRTLPPYTFEDDAEMPFFASRGGPSRRVTTDEGGSPMVSSRHVAREICPVCGGIGNGGPVGTDEHPCRCREQYLPAWVVREMMAASERRIKREIREEVWAELDR
ncbi:MAG: hypothetical protein LQ340_007647, partial [Diploschistes diacapsis]